RSVSLRFFDPDQNVLVPDPRYVLAEPAAAMPGQVIEFLLGGPSDALTGAVHSAIGPKTTPATNVVQAPDGALVVNLTKLGDQHAETKRQIAAQVVLSLQDVTTSRIRLQVDGFPLIPSQQDFRASDVDSYDAAAIPNPQLPGLYLAGGVLRSLRD